MTQTSVPHEELEMGIEIPREVDTALGDWLQQGRGEVFDYFAYPGDTDTTELVVAYNDPKTNHDERAEIMDAIIAAHAHILRGYAKVSADFNTPAGDLVNEGFIGLVRAIEYFDPSRGFPFIALARTCIRQQIGVAVKSSHPEMIDYREIDPELAVAVDDEAATGISPDEADRQFEELINQYDLPEKDRQVLRLACGVGGLTLTSREMGEILGISMGAARQRKTRAIRRFQELSGINFISQD